MRELTRSQYWAARDVALHDHGCEATHGVTASGALLTIIHRMEASRLHTWGLRPWLTSITTQATGRTIYMLHDSAAHIDVVDAALDTPPV